MRRWSTGDRRSAPSRWPSGQPAPLWAASHYLDAHRDQRDDSGTSSPAVNLDEAVPEPRRPDDGAPDGERREQEGAATSEHAPDSRGPGSDGSGSDPYGSDCRPEAPVDADRTAAAERRGRHRADQAGVPVARLLERDRDVTAPSWAAVLGTSERPGRLRETLVLGRYRPLTDDEANAAAPALTQSRERPAEPSSAIRPLYPASQRVPVGSRREALRSGVLLVLMLLAGSVTGYHVLGPSSTTAALPPADTSPYGATGALPGSLSTPLPDTAPGQAPQEAGLPPTAGLSGIPATVLAAYHSAETQLAGAAPGCRLSWSLLAGIGKIESDHARGGQVDTTGTTLHPILGPVLDGTGGNAAITDTDGGRLDGDTVHDRAVGPMQFLPGTWATWGVDASGDGRADPNNTADAATAAGRYLCAGSLDTSTPTGAHDAVFRYNHSETYVAHVLAWARAYATGTIPTPDNPTGDTTDPLPGPSNTEPSSEPSSGATGNASGPGVLAARPTVPAAAAAGAPPVLASGGTLVPITAEPTAPSGAAAPPRTSSARSTTAPPSAPSSAISSPPTTTTPPVPTTTTPSVPATTSTRPRSATPSMSTHPSGAPTTTTTPCPTTTVTSTVGVTASLCAPVLDAPSPIAATAPAPPTTTATSSTSAPTSAPISTTAPTAPSSSSPASRPHPAHTTAAGAASTSTAGGSPSAEEGLVGGAQDETPVTSGASGEGSTLDTTTSGIRALLGDIQTEGAPQPTLVTNPAGQGLRFALPAGGRRSEVIPPLAEYREGQQMWLHYRAQLSGVPVETNTWQLIAQFHHDGNTGSPPIALEVGHGRLRLANQGAHQQDLGPVTSDGLVDVVLHVVFSRDPARGQVDVWRDGAPILAGYHPPGGTLLDGGDYLKLGLYRDPAITQPSSVTVLAVQARPTPLPTSPTGS